MVQVRQENSQLENARALGSEMGLNQSLSARTGFLGIICGRHVENLTARKTCTIIVTVLQCMWHELGNI